MPRLHIDLKKVKHNARLVRELIEPFGLRLVAVTKACLGDGEVAAATFAGPVTAGYAIADSRLENIKSVRRRLPGLSEENVELLRPPLETTKLVPNLIYHVASAGQAEVLLEKRPYKYYQMSLCLQVDAGDGREGVPAQQAAAEARSIAELEGAHFMGIATNLACADPSVPLQEALLLFNRTVEEVRRAIATAEVSVFSSDPAIREEQIRTRFIPSPPSLSIVSAGGSGLLKLLLELPAAAAAPLFEPLTELRCGEAILLGRVPSGEEPELLLPGAHRDAFVLEGTVLEVFHKAGRQQAVVNIGIQDIGAGRLAPLEAGVKPVLATSDYLVAELPEESGASGMAGGAVASVGAPGSAAAGSGANRGRPPAAGDRIGFIPDYYALLGAMTSPFVDRFYEGRMK